MAGDLRGIGIALERLSDCLVSTGAQGLCNFPVSGDPSRRDPADHGLATFDPGFVWLAVRTGAVVVPTAVHGAYQLMPKGAKYPRRGPLWIRIGEPISYANEARRVPRTRLIELAEEARQRTLEMLAGLAAATGVPNPAVETGDWQP